ncbi:hypothetical protein B0T19DRAFT_423750 [Cercophora scortea]|uniref:BZIP domain-containing protein n=1 Tax=Cercophora scortea TaxID=314031 RepID=A0AAE0IN98_9PEZI|nr:hypothetical protein B0T19DRAFT_423750 [Cercophora scortea]
MSLTSHSVPPYSLPSADEVKLAVEDDWTQVKDRKEKKKIQNRVAQRTYRHRMKARLGELQSRLEFHEGKKAYSTETGEGTAVGINISNGSESSGNCNSTSTSTSNGKGNGGVLQLQGLTPTTTEDSSPSPRPTEESQDHREMARSAYHNPHNAPSSNSPSALFGQPVDLTHCQSPSQVLPPSQDQQAAYFPPRQVDHGAKLSQSIMQDCLRFQMQLLDKLNNSMPDEQNFADMSSSQRDDLTALFNLQSEMDMNQIGGGGNQPFSPDSHNMMDFSFNGPHHDIWPCESPAASQEVHVRQASIPPPPPPPPPRTSPQHAENKPMPPTTNPAALMRPATDMQAPRPPSQPPTQSQPHPRSLARDASLDERFESVMERVEAAGFDNFDELATAYYSERFPEPSPLAIEQRLSRNRRLPKLFASVFEASQGWTAWERRGFLEEVLKTAETMLIAEGRGAQSRGLEGSIVNALLQTTGVAAGGSSSSPPAGTTPPAGAAGSQNLNQGIPAMKRLIENDLPNLWALTTALASENRALRQRERSNTVLATIVMLQCAGRVPKQSLLSLVDACLQ